MNKPTQLFEASRMALGAPQAIAAIETISSVADCAGPHGTYTTEIHSARGGRVRFLQVRAHRHPIAIIINEHGAWATDIATGETDAIDAASVSMVRGHEFQMLPLTLAERYRDWQTVTETEWNNEPCFQIRATDDLGMPCAHFFRRDNYRWFGMELTGTRHAGEKIHVVVHAWRAVKKVLLPSHISVADATGEYILQFTDIRLNQADAKKFATPSLVSRDALVV